VTNDPVCDAAHGDVLLPPDLRRLVVVFDSPVARELAFLGERLGWPVTRYDPLEGELGTLGPDCDVVVCDHDRVELGDVLAEILSQPTRLVGVMGSLRHTAPHVEALRTRGFSEPDITRVHRPIGLDIGSHTPVEIAISTIAGLIADRNGRSGGTYPHQNAAASNT
jgi:xanthine dehydrogenase accessory factor